MSTPLPEARDDSSRIRRLTGVVSARPLPIQGELSDYPIAELLQFLAQTRRTGHLALERGDPPLAAAIHVDQGRIIDASCTPLRGDEAVMHLVGWRQGRFLFMSGVASATRTVHAEMHFLLLEGTRRSDEVRAAMAGLPREDVLLHPVYDTTLIDRPLSRIAWQVLNLIDGTRSVLDLVEAFGRGQVTVARALNELLAQGFATVVPETGFLDEVIPRRVASASGLEEATSDLLAACTGNVTLRRIAVETGLAEAVVVRTVADLIQDGLLCIVSGQEAWRLHGDPLGACAE